MMLAIVIMTIVGIWLFGPSFSLGFGGDEYLALLDLKRALAETGSKWFSWKFLLSNYGPTDILFAAIYKLSGLSQQAVFVVSFGLRWLASVSCVWIVYRLTKSKIGAVMSGTFFLVSLAGLETTSWSFNLISYLAITLMNCFWYVWLGQKSKPSITKYLIMGVLFWLSVVVIPIRMGGFLVSIVIVEGYWMVKHLGIKSIGGGILNLILVLGLFCTFFVLGESFGKGANWKERVQSAWSNQAVDQYGGLTGRLRRGQYGVLLNPLAQLGAVIAPTRVVTQGELNLNYYLIIYVLTVWVLGKCINKTQSRTMLVIMIGLGVAWAVTVQAIINSNPQITSQYGSWLSVGGYWLLIVGILIVKTWHRMDENLGLSIGIVWMVMSVCFFWLRFPGEVQMTYHRYLISPSLGVAWIVGITVSLGQSRRKRLVLGTMVGILIIMHATETKQYLDNLRTVRGYDLVRSIRGDLPNIAKFGVIATRPHPPVYYFEARKEDQEILRNSVMFGFPAVVAVMDGLDYFPPLVYVSDWSDVVSMHNSGQGVDKYGWPVKPVPIEYIFGYRLAGNRLVETTEEIRSKLSEP